MNESGAILKVRGLRLPNPWNHDCCAVATGSHTQLGQVGKQE